MYERADNIITEPEDQMQEISHINNALRECGYPDWSFKEIRERINSKNTKQQKKMKRKKQVEKNDGQDKIIVTIPFVRGVSEAVEQTLRRPGIATAVRPCKALHQFLVHPKDKRSVQESTGVVHSIPCKD